MDDQLSSVQSLEQVGRGGGSGGHGGWIQPSSSSSLFCGRPSWAVPAWLGMSTLWCCPSSICSADPLPPHKKISTHCAFICVLYFFGCYTDGQHKILYMFMDLANGVRLAFSWKLFTWTLSNFCILITSSHLHTRFREFDWIERSQWYQKVETVLKSADSLSVKLCTVVSYVELMKGIAT